VEGSCEHGNETSGFIKYWEGLSSVSEWVETRLCTFVFLRLQRMNIFIFVTFLVEPCIRGSGLEMVALYKVACK
jgi:hypothetical protein